MIDINTVTNMVLKGDCLEIMSSMPDNSIDIVFTDPPYGIGLDKDVSRKSGEQYGVSKAKKGIYRSTNWDAKRPDKEVFEEIFRISKNQIIFGGNYFADLLPASPCWIVWDKFINGNFADCELVWTSFETAVRKIEWIWNGMIQQDMKNKEKRYHPTQKPVGLCTEILRRYGKEGMKIFDPFCGSGSLLIGAIKNNMSFIGCDTDSEYIDIAKHRTDEAFKQGSLWT